MLKIIKEAIKGPIIDWNNYLKDYEILALKTNLAIPETTIQHLIEDGRLEISDNKTFDDLVDELKSWLENHNSLTEGIHLTAFVKDKQSKETVTIEDDSYPNKLAFKKDLRANGYIVKNIYDNRDLYLMDHSDFPSISDLKAKIKFYTDMQKDAIHPELWNDQVKELQDLLDKANSISLNENKQISNKILSEAGRNDLLRKSRKESPGRWERREYYKNFRVVNTDISDLDDEDTVVVEFEVGDYKAYVAFSNILLNLREIVKQDPKHMVKFDWVIRACNRAIDQANIYVRCSCYDFKYRFSYISSKNKYIYGKRELRPADIRNPNDDKGRML